MHHGDAISKASDETQTLGAIEVEAETAMQNAIERSPVTTMPAA